MKLTEHFSLAEFECKCGCAMQDRHRDNVFRVAMALELGLRKPLGEPVIITSGYRCITHNKAVKGAKCSMHTLGMAADLKVKGILALELKGWIEAMIATDIMPQGGLGIYNHHPFLLHYDVRGFRSRWNRG